MLAKHSCVRGSSKQPASKVVRIDGHCAKSWIICFFPLLSVNECVLSTCNTVNLKSYTLLFPYELSITASDIHRAVFFLTILHLFHQTWPCFLPTSTLPTVEMVQATMRLVIMQCNFHTPFSSHFYRHSPPLIADTVRGLSGMVICFSFQHSFSI